MNKPQFKSLMALLCLILGVLLLISALVINAFGSTTYTLLLAFGGVLVVIGAIAYYITYLRIKTISLLKNKQLPILAHWTYLPSEFKTIHTALVEEKHSTFSMIILTTFLILLIAIGFILTNPTLYLRICITLGILIIVLALTCSLCVQIYYKNKLTHPVEALISEEFIYFCGELYGLNRSLYILETVQIIEGPQNVMQFIYGSPGTPYDPIHILTIPIPAGNLDHAKEIRTHFIKRLENHS
ncbi:MAG: hypothetical protein ACRCW2_04575 [Cellulosilyticaceae bacterium]